MVNHAESASVQYIYQRREQEFKLTVKQEINDGDQIFINYGTYGSFDKLLDYGYVEGGMPNYSESFFVGKEEIFHVIKELGVLPNLELNGSEEEDIEDFEIFRASISPDMQEFLEYVTNGNDNKAMQIKIELFSSIVQNLRNSLGNLFLLILFFIDV